jgi:rhodanese-related sulfurtransferase
MNIQKFIRTNRLFLAALLIIVVVLAIVLSLRAPAIAYTVNPEMVPVMLADSGNQVSPLSLFELMSKNPAGIVVVDVRSSDEFSKGHIEKAKNIPVRELLTDKSISFFAELKKINSVAVLYGEDQLQANGPWMLLRQIGIDNVKMLQGGYSFYKTLPLADSLVNKNKALWLVEIPIIDTTAFKKTIPANAVKIVDKKVKKEKVIPVKKEVSTGGGC